MKDDLGTILHAVHTAPLHLDLKKLRPDACAMEVIAHEVAKVDAEEEFKLKLAQVVLAAEYDGAYKHVEVNMRGIDGNAFMILGTVKKVLNKAGAPKFHVEVFMHRAKEGDYQHLLATCTKWVTIVDQPIHGRAAADAFNKLPKED